MHDLIYSHKPQRSGRSITANTNNPPQDPPSPPVVETPVVETPVVETPVVETPVVETPVVETPVVDIPIIDIPIENTIPPIVESCPQCDTTPPSLEKPKKLSLFSRIKRFFWRR